MGNQKPSIDEGHTIQCMARRIYVQDIYNILCQTLKKLNITIHHFEIVETKMKKLN